MVDPPVLISPRHEVGQFESGEPVLDEWLRQRALKNLQLAASRTYVACEAGGGRVVGFYALSMGQILASDVTGAMRRNMPKFIPAVVLGRLAVDRVWQGKRLGQALLVDAINRAIRASEQVSARLVVVHAISPAAEAFYRHHGFTRLPVETPSLALDLLKLQKFRVS